MEEWKEIEGYPQYHISTLGKVINTKTGKILKPRPNVKGYGVVAIYNPKRKDYLVHRLVCQSFVPNPENKSQVNHINGNKLDNRAENLEWATPKENVIHSWESGYCKSPAGIKNGSSKLTEQQAIEILTKYKQGEKPSSLSKIYKVSERQIGRIITGQSWKHLNLD